LGWIGIDNEQLVEVTREHKVTSFTPLSEGGNVYKLATQNPSEYFLVEHRRSGSNHYERSLPADGLLIWHVLDFFHTNSFERKKRVDLVCADGLYEDGGFPEGRVASPFTGGDNLDFWSHDPDYTSSHAGNLGDATDLFDGVHYQEFSRSSNPPAVTGIEVLNIRREGGRLAADLRSDIRQRSGMITTDEVWRDSIIVVGDVLVAPEAKLTILPGTVVAFDSDQDGEGLDAELVELIVDGELIGRRVEFTSAAPLPRPGDWYGIIVHFQGLIDMRNSVIEYAHDGISGGGWTRPHTLESVAIRRVSQNGIRLVRIREPLTLSGVEVSEAGSEGVRIQGTGPVRVVDSRFIDNASNGLIQIGGSLHLLNSSFVDNALATTDGANLVVDHIRGRIADNQFSGGVGIRIIDSRNLVIEDNALSRHQIGLLSSNSRPRIETNRLIANQLALQIEGAAVPVRVALNTVEGTGRFLDNRASSEVNAANNWWGFEDELSIGQRMEGAVEWRPFLNVDPRLPLDFALTQNYPNPFNSGTTIEYTVGASALESDHNTVLDIWAVNGSLVRRLVDQSKLPGRYTVTWDGRNDRGHPVASAVYLYRLRIGSHTETQRLLLLK
jgi:hypothetical protein